MSRDPVKTLRENFVAVSKRLAEAEAEIERLRARLKLWDPGEADHGSGSVTLRSYPAYNTAE